MMTIMMKKCVMHSKIDNIEIMINDELDELNFLIHLKINMEII